jgi:hypothetical protein
MEPLSVLREGLRVDDESVADIGGEHSLVGTVAHGDIRHSEVRMFESSIGPAYRGQVTHVKCVGNPWAGGQSGPMSVALSRPRSASIVLSLVADVEWAAEGNP